MGLNIFQTFEKVLNIDLVEVIISNSSNKDVCQKMKLRPVLLKGNLLFQLSSFVGQQVLHENLKKEDVLRKVEQWLHGEVTFRQMEIKTKTSLIIILVSKKGKITIKEKRSKQPVEQRDISHNRKKQYLIEEGIAVPFLIDLGVMTKEGQIVKSKYDKYRQINRFLEFIEDILPSLPKDRKITILDFGCGKSYLTFAMYYYLKEMKRYDIQIIGLDLKKDVIAHCNQLSKQYGYENLAFYEGDISSYEGVSQVDMVVTLHACDTATDYALYKAIRWGASVILSVPCCQHEINKQIDEKSLQPIFQYGLLKERSAALITDGLRVNLLEQWGYKTQILEFIDMEHTPKNILIRAVKSSSGSHKKIEYNKKTGMSYEQCLAFFGIRPTLHCLLEEYREELANKK